MNPQANSTRNVFTYGDLVIEYSSWPSHNTADDRKTAGDSKTALVALHGFSRPLEDMALLLPYLQPHEQLLAIHLPAHGRSSGHHRPLELSVWADAMEALAASLELRLGGRTVAYSLGGRVGLSWWMAHPEAMSYLVLIAPDGLRRSPGYAWSVDTALGRSILKHSLRHRAGMVRWTNRLFNWRLISKHHHQFTLFHLESDTMWSMVQDCWLSMRQFWPHGVRDFLRANPGCVEIHLGERDKIIPRSVASKIDNLAHVHFHPFGHGLLRDEVLCRIGDGQKNRTRPATPTHHGHNLD
jgi:pimeloyl-ACP methyl ester carboxylesterase